MTEWGESGPPSACCCFSSVRTCRFQLNALPSPACVLSTHTLGSFAHRRDATPSRRRDETWDCRLGMGRIWSYGRVAGVLHERGERGPYRLIQRIEETRQATRRLNVGVDRGVASEPGDARAEVLAGPTRVSGGLGRALPTPLGKDNACAVGIGAASAGRPCIRCLLLPPTCRGVFIGGLCGLCGTGKLCDCCCGSAARARAGLCCDSF